MPKTMTFAALPQLLAHIELYAKLVDTVIPNVLALDTSPGVFRLLLIDHYNILFPREFSEQELRTYIIALIITLFGKEKAHIERSQKLLPKMCILVAILTATKVKYRLAEKEDSKLINELLDHSLKSIIPISVATVLGIGIFNPHSISGHGQLETAVKAFYKSLESDEIKRLEDRQKVRLKEVQQIIREAFIAFYGEHNITDQSSLEGFEQALEKTIAGYFSDPES